MNIENKKILVDEIDILSSNKFVKTLSTPIILKKYINLNNFDNLKDFLTLEVDNNSSFVKTFLAKYENYTKCVNKM